MEGPREARNEKEKGNGRGGVFLRQPIPVYTSHVDDINTGCYAINPIFFVKFFEVSYGAKEMHSLVDNREKR